MLDRELWTRDLCEVGLVLGWGASLSSMATGIYILAAEPTTVPSWLVMRVALVGPMGYAWKDPTKTYINDHRVYSVSETAMILIPLLIQIAITAVAACLDTIHSTTLRWSLWREGRLCHNTNLRLFTFSKEGPNAWPANMASGLGLVLAYGRATVMAFPVIVIATLEYKPDDPRANPMNYHGDFGPDRFGISFNGWGLLGLGVGFLLQSAICTWCLVHDAKRHVVGTWSSNPLAAAKACHILQCPAKHENSGFPLSTPSPRQPSMRVLVPASRTFTRLLWAVFTLHGLSTLAVALVASQLQHSTTLAFVRANPAPVDLGSVWKLFGQVRIKYNGDATGPRREWIGLLIQSSAVATALFGLHLADVLCGLARDEAIWRRATRRHGADARSGVLREGARHWPTGVVFACKALMPWILSYGFVCNGRVFLALFPLLTVALLYLALSVFAEYLARAEPRGAQLAAYGDVRALAAAVDEWDHDPLFWGDKGEDATAPGVRVAGTAGWKLPDPREGVLYAGLRDSRALGGC